jgi:hypothetical protein
MAKAIARTATSRPSIQSADLVALVRQPAGGRGDRQRDFVCARAQEFDFEQDGFDLAHTRCRIAILKSCADYVGGIGCGAPHGRAHEQEEAT